MSTPITKYNPKFENQDFPLHDNFVNQLPPEERYEFDEIELELMQKRTELWIAEIAYNNFIEDRNHPDQVDVRDQPCWENVEDLEKQIEELKTKLETFDYDDYEVNRHYYRTKVSA